ncbi:MAG: hypothetical protein GY861_21555 [bacterium]|nr:hypothetical protein [bacterium]
MNVCLNCKKHCCTWCDKFKDGVCSIYEDRPEVCKVFPWIFNLYAERVQVLHTCPQWKYFKEKGCPNIEFLLSYTEEFINTFRGGNSNGSVRFD